MHEDTTCGALGIGAEGRIAGEKRKKAGPPPLRSPVVRTGPSRVERSRGESSRLESSRVESSGKSPPLTSRRARLQSALESCTTEHARDSRVPAAGNELDTRARSARRAHVSTCGFRVISIQFSESRPGRRSRCAGCRVRSRTIRKWRIDPCDKIRGLNDREIARRYCIMSHSHANDGRCCWRDGEPSQHRRRLTFALAWSG